MGDNNSNLKKMLKIYKPKGFDWMNFALSRRNPYTFHHIVARSNGGGDSIDNGAILTRRAHDLLHLLEYIYPDAYRKLQMIFMEVNASRKAPNEEMMHEIDEILQEVFSCDNHDFVIDTDLSEFSEIYYGNKKSRVKKQRK